MRPLHAISPSFRTRAGRWTLAARVLACLCLGMLAACATIAPAGDPSAALTFVVVRHAEKAGDDPRDPSLSEAGQARAQALARLLADEPLTAAHATGYRRTQQTAQPAADAHSLRLTLYDAQLPATTLASQLRASYRHGTVLVVGHSNTVPDIAAALSGQTVQAMTDDQYGLIYRIAIDADGKATLSRQTY